MPKKSRGQQNGNPITRAQPTPAGGVQLETFVPWNLVKRTVKKQVITPFDAPQEFSLEARQEQNAQESEADSKLLQTIGLAHHWQRLLDEDRFSSMTEIAAVEGIDLAQASKISRLILLAPDLLDAVTSGRLTIGVSQVLRGKLFSSWQAQRRMLLSDSSCLPTRSPRVPKRVSLVANEGCTTTDNAQIF
ncbi:MAG: hypothetical protein Q8M20_11280 [Rhodocyclaceae bacterium]|nr:hypothetical protein [Rhodocyclaceae bacterium]MDZ4216309.1 hypothetical protein [Rhodocyclaceae bacterium]